MSTSKSPASLAAGRAPEAFCLAAERSENSETAFPLQASHVVGINTGIGGALACLLAALASRGRAFQ